MNSQKGNNTKKHLWNRLDNIGKGIFIVLILLAIAMAIFPDQFVNIASFGLVAVTMAYAYFTSQQAEASIKMLDEMKEERLSTSQPVMIQKSVNIYSSGGIDTGQFSHFSILNAGNGTALGLTYVMMDKNKQPITQGRRETYLKTGEDMKYYPSSEITNLPKDQYYLFCQYSGVSQLTGRKSINQTWLPFHITKEWDKDFGSSIITFDPMFEFDVSQTNSVKIYTFIEAN